MFFSRIVIQLVLTIALCYLAYRLFCLEQRMDKLEVKIQEDVIEHSTTISDIMQEEHVDHSQLIQPSQLSTKPVKKSTLKKLTIEQLTSIADENQVSTKHDDGKHLKKTEIIEKILSSSSKKDTDK